MSEDNIFKTESGKKVPPEMVSSIIELCDSNNIYQTCRSLRQYRLGNINKADWSNKTLLIKKTWTQPNFVRYEDVHDNLWRLYDKSIATLNFDVSASRQVRNAASKFFVDDLVVTNRYGRRKVEGRHIDAMINVIGTWETHSIKLENHIFCNHLTARLMEKFPDKIVPIAPDVPGSMMNYNYRYFLQP